VWPDKEHGLLYGLLLGSILAATDPVSVLALFKTMGAPKRLTVLVEGESLFNDGTAVVLFNILLYAVLETFGGNMISNTDLILSGLAQFIMVIVIGLLVGFIGGVVTNWVLRKTSDYLVEVSMTVALAFGTFLVAELLHGSGVIATVVGGLLVGNQGTRFGMSATARVGLHHFWEIITFLINSVLFLLIGYEIQISLELTMAEFKLAGIAILATLVARLVVYPLVGLSNIKNNYPIPKNWKHVIFWSGLRGSIPIALLLLISNMTLHETNGAIFDSELYGELLVMSFGVVLWTLLVQGITLKPLMSGLGIGGVSKENEQVYEVSLAESMGARTALDSIERMYRTGLLSDVDRDQMDLIYVKRLELAESNMRHHALHNKIHSQRLESARRELIMDQMTTIREAERGGLLSSDVSSKALKLLDEEFHLSSIKQEEKIAADEEILDVEDTTIVDALIGTEGSKLPDSSFSSMVPPETEELLFGHGDNTSEE
jgi:CPA1 family monovalent cation:H+ antiporter